MGSRCRTIVTPRGVPRDHDHRLAPVSVRRPLPTCCHHDVPDLAAFVGHPGESTACGRSRRTRRRPGCEVEVSMFVASEDATSGSVIAKADWISPASSGCSHRPFCSAVPNAVQDFHVAGVRRQQLIASGAIARRPPGDLGDGRVGRVRPGRRPRAGTGSTGPATATPTSSAARSRRVRSCSPCSRRRAAHSSSARKACSRMNAHIRSLVSWAAALSEKSLVQLRCGK